MKAYVYQAALLCEDCGIEASRRRCEDPRPLDVNNSEDFPQGPYPDGGGEADAPQSCDHCFVFLENPLTSEGMAALEEQWAAEETARRRCKQDVMVDVWAPFYGLQAAAVDDEAAAEEKWWAACQEVAERTVCES